MPVELLLPSILLIILLSPTLVLAVYDRRIASACEWFMEPSRRFVITELVSSWGITVHELEHISNHYPIRYVIVTYTESGSQQQRTVSVSITKFKRALIKMSGNPTLETLLAEICD